MKNHHLTGSLWSDDVQRPGLLADRLFTRYSGVTPFSNGHMIHWIKDTGDGAFKGRRPVGRYGRFSRRAVVLVREQL